MGFLAPWSLVGLATLGIPIFVHLLRKHVVTPRPVSSLMFFERGIQSSTRHRRLRYLLLFALRFLLLLLIVLAFADPFIRRFASDTHSHLLLIVVDRSFSMRAGTRFSDAKQQALSLLASKPRSQRAQILMLGGRVEVLTQPTPDSNLLRSTLEGIQVGDGQGNFGALGRTVRTLNEAAPGPVDLHLFSDMQRTGMPGNFADAVLPPHVDLILHDVAKVSASPNWTVESINAPVELLDPKDTTKSHVQAVIAGSSTPEATKKISFVVDGKTLLSREVKVPANGRATVEFAPLDIKYGFNRCEVRIEGDDALPADNGSVFVVRRSDPQRILFVHRAADERSALYFGTALNAASHGAFILQPVAVEQVTDLDPNKFAFTVLSDVTSLPSIFEHTLEQYLSKGGSVFMALGLDAGRRAHLPLWGGDLQKIRNFASSEESAVVGQVDFTYPGLEQAQPGRDNGGWAGAKFFYAMMVDPSHARVAARLSDGTPLLLEKPIGEGHLLLFASGLENLTNDLPLHPVFVNFVDKTSRYLSGSEQLSGVRMVDSFVQLRNTAETNKSVTATSEVIDPDGRRPLSLADSQKVQTFRLSRAGFYQIHFANGRSAVIGVNPDRRESNLEPMSQEIRALWARGKARTPEAEKTPVAGTKFQYVSLWWYAMLLAFVVAVMETVFSTRYLGTQREEL